MGVQLDLDRETEALIQQIVGGGRYRDAGEVVREAVRQLAERDRRLAELRAALAVAEEQVARGEVVEWTPQLAADIWEATVGLEGGADDHRRAVDADGDV
jgi:putative addiction module CopG family antidote